jgi:membrane protein implicated in regulation of membrane protease activity
MVFVWVALAVLLIFVELHHVQFFALFAAAGALAAGAVALVAPDAYVAQVVVAAAVATVGVVAVRPQMKNAIERHQGGKLGRGVHGTLVGEEVLTLDVIGDEHEVGHVRLAGERWLAVSGSGLPIPAGQRVLVTGVRGTTLTVWPTDGTRPPPLGLHDTPRDRGDASTHGAPSAGAAPDAPHPPQPAPTQAEGAHPEGETP